MPPLRALVEAGHDVALVVSQPDRKRGRGGALVASPVKLAATALGLPVSERADSVVAAGAELGVVVAFGRLIRPPVLAALPMINVHFSLLPRWRGAAPVERAILAGDEVTGVCIMALEETLDTGPVYLREELAIDPDESAEELRGRLVSVGTRMLVGVLSEAGLPDPEPQTGEPTYAAKLEPAEHHLEWERPAADLRRVVRIGQAWTTFRGRRLKVARAGRPEAGALAAGEVAVDGRVVRVGTGEGVLPLLEVQPEGKGVQAAEAWARGARPAAGERFE